MYLTINELCDKLNDSDDKIKMLFSNKNDTTFFKVLQLVFLEKYQFHNSLGVGYPEDTKINRDLPPDLTDSNLRNEFRTFYLFDQSYKLDNTKRLKIFRGVLEVIPHEEADLIINIKDGKFKELFPNITYELLNEFDNTWFPEKTELQKMDTNTPLNYITGYDELSTFGITNIVTGTQRSTVMDYAKPKEFDDTKVIAEKQAVEHTKNSTKPKGDKVDRRSKAFRLASGRDKE